MPATPMQRVAAMIATAKLSDLARAKLFELCLEERAITEKLINTLVSYGLTTAIPAELLRSNKQIDYIAPAITVFDYLPDSETTFCFHGTFKRSGTYGQLHIGPHIASADCNPIRSATHARQIAQQLAGESFALLLNTYALRHIAVYADGSVDAIAYGTDKRIALRRS